MCFPGTQILQFVQEICFFTVVWRKSFEEMLGGFGMLVELVFISDVTSSTLMR